MRGDKHRHTYTCAKVYIITYMLLKILDETQTHGTYIHTLTHTHSHINTHMYAHT